MSVTAGSRHIHRSLTSHSGNVIHGHLRTVTYRGTVSRPLDDPSAPRATGDLTGRTVGPYRLAQRIGEGGMGVVYLGLDAEHRAVAVKVLRPHVAGDPDARRRLEREVSSLQRVRHPRVAQVLDADVHGPLPYVATEYVPAVTLDNYVVEHGPFAAPALARLGFGLGDALGAIHRAGVVHRDLKPGNVLVVDGDPVVIDFGIAHVADDARLTMTGLVMGTPGYLSPELIEGGTVDRATDWWGWAATMTFAATGRAPFGKGPMEVVLDRVRRGEADLDGVPLVLVSVLRSALSPEPASRPRPAELRSALTALAEHTVVLDSAASSLTQLVPSGATTTPAAPYRAEARSAHSDQAPADQTRVQARIDQTSPGLTARSAGQAETVVQPVSSRQGETRVFSSAPPVTPTAAGVGASAAGRVTHAGQAGAAGQIVSTGQNVPAGQNSTAGEAGRQPKSLRAWWRGDSTPPAARANLPSATAAATTQFPGVETTRAHPTASPHSSSNQAPAQAYPPPSGQRIGGYHPSPGQPEAPGLSAPRVQSAPAQQAHVQQPWVREAPVQQPLVRQAPVQPVPAPDNEDSAARSRPARTGTMLTALLLLVAGMLTAPFVTVAAFAVVSALARTVDRISWTLVRRRNTHGKRLSDVFVAALQSPLHLVAACFGAVFALILPVVLAICGYFATGLVVPLGEGTLRGLAPLVVAGAVLGLSAWWGLGGGSLRRGSRALARGVTPGGIGATFAVGLLLLFIVAVLSVLYAAHGQQNWYPWVDSPLDQLVALGNGRLRYP